LDTEVRRGKVHVTVELRVARVRLPLVTVLLAPPLVVRVKQAHPLAVELALAAVLPGHVQHPPGLVQGKRAGPGRCQGVTTGFSESMLHT
jgi:hypothetical protein